MRDYTADCLCLFFSSNVSEGIEQLFSSAVQAELRLRTVSGAYSAADQVEPVPSDHRIIDWLGLEGTLKITYFQPS